MPKIGASTVIMDFDNTLYDWVGQWYQSFHAMFSEIQRISGLPEADLKKEIRKVHQRHHTSEYAFLIEELDIIRDGSVEATVEKYRSAIDAFKSARRIHLSMYPDAFAALLALKKAGKKLVVFTESQTFYTVMRFKRFELDGIVDFLFTSDDHEVPGQEYLDKVRNHSPDFYRIQLTKHRSVGRGRIKPDPEILLQIAEEVGALKSDALYVGDSLYKDVAMAKSAQVFGVWARYGESREQSGYNFLREVSHWTDEDVQKDRDLKSKDVTADAVLEDSFQEILDLLNLGGNDFVREAVS